jgi:hypothetical protein
MLEEKVILSIEDTRKEGKENERLTWATKSNVTRLLLKRRKGTLHGHSFVNIS